MDIERFHNELAMRLGYERIVENKRIQISIEESDDPWLTLKIDGNEDIRFKASDVLEEVDFLKTPEMCDEIKQISDAVHYAYIESTKELALHRQSREVAERVERPSAEVR